MKRDPMFEKGKKISLNGVKVKYAHVYDPDTKFEPEWSITMVIDDKKSRDQLTDVGFNIKQDKAGDFVLKAKTKVVSKGGRKNFPPRVIDAEGNNFTEPIGDGSICDVEVWCKYRDVSGKTYLPAYLNTVRVHTHVAREAAEVQPFFSTM